MSKKRIIVLTIAILFDAVLLFFIVRATVKGQAGKNEEVLSEPEESSVVSQEVVSSEDEAVKEISVDKSEITLCVGETEEINAIGGSDITFLSEDESIAVIENNKITGKNAGKTVIKAKSGEYEEACCTVTVKAAPKELGFSRKNITLFVGESIEISCYTDDIGINAPEFSFGDCVSVSIGNAEKCEDGYEITLDIDAVSYGEDMLSAETYNGLSDECAIDVIWETDQAYLDDFNVIDQWINLPTGCEITALTMALNYEGFDVSNVELADNYLPYTYDYGSDPRYYFLGHPSDYEGAGCYAPCIVTMAENYLHANGAEDEWEVIDLSGSDPSVLYDYVAKDVPVVVWITSSMKEPYVNAYCEGEDGVTVPWMFPEHCAVLIGYDNASGTVEIADSEYGCVMTRDMGLFEHIYDAMMSQAVVVVKK